MGGQSTTTQTYQNNEPWAPAQPYLLQGLQDAQRVYNNQEANGTKFTGPFVAQPTAAQTAGANNLLNFATGTGQSAVNNQLSSGAAMTSQGASGLGNTIGALNSFAGTDATSANLASASQYANNPYLQGQIDAATRDAKATYNEQTVPGINATAAGTGNINSTRTYVAQGIAQRGLANTIADTSAQMRSAAWNTGLQAAQQDRATQLAALQSSGQLSQGLTNAGVNNSNSAWSGLGANTSAYTIGDSAVTANNQAPIDEKLNEINYANSQPWQNLQNEWSVFSGAGTLGGTSTGYQTQRTNPGAMGILGGMTGILGSLFRSDVRTKDLIAHVDTRDDGIPLYLYTYKDDAEKTPHIAPLAQDVERLYPHAVFNVGDTKYIHLPTFIAASTGSRD